MKNVVVGKTKENVRNNRDIKLMKTDPARYYLISEPNYHRTTFFSKTLLAIEMKKKNKHKYS